MKKILIPAGCHKRKDEGEKGARIIDGDQHVTSDYFYDEFLEQCANFG